MPEYTKLKLIYQILDSSFHMLTPSRAPFTFSEAEEIIDVDVAAASQAAADCLQINNGVGKKP